MKFWAKILTSLIRPSNRQMINQNMISTFCTVISHLCPVILQCDLDEIALLAANQIEEILYTECRSSMFQRAKETVEA